MTASGDRAAQQGDEADEDILAYWLHLYRQASP